MLIIIIIIIAFVIFITFVLFYDALTRPPSKRVFYKGRYIKKSLKARFEMDKRVRELEEKRIEDKKISNDLLNRWIKKEIEINDTSITPSIINLLTDKVEDELYKIKGEKEEEENILQEKYEKTDNAQTLENISFFVIIVFLIASVCFVLFFI